MGRLSMTSSNPKHLGTVRHEEQDGFKDFTDIGKLISNSTRLFNSNHTDL